MVLVQPQNAPLDTILNQTAHALTIHPPFAHLMVHLQLSIATKLIMLLQEVVLTMVYVKSQPVMMAIISLQQLLVIFVLKIHLMPVVQKMKHQPLIVLIKTTTLSLVLVKMALVRLQDVPSVII